MYWGIPVSLYLFLAGASAGAFALALGLGAWARGAGAGSDAGDVRALTATARRVGFAAAPVLLAVGAVFLIVDARGGLSHPLSYLGVFSNFGSVMTWGAWIILLSLVAQVAALVVSAGGREVSDGARKAGTVAGLVLAAALAVYTGVLLGVAAPVPLWNSAALVVLFALSAGLSGVALVFLVGFLVDRENTLALVGRLEAPILVAEVVEVVTLVAHLALTATRGAAGAGSVESLVAGDYAIAFWVGLVIVGLALPLAANAAGSVRARRSGVVAGALAGTVIGAVVLRVVIVGAASFTVVSPF